MHDLLENALSAIRLGVEDYASDDSQRPASAARNIHAGLLLLYKEKLRRLSPDGSSDSLLMERVRPAISQSGDVVWVGTGKKTAGRQQIQQRLEDLQIAVDWKRFDKIAHLRHQLEHYHTAATPETIREVVANAFILIGDFLEQHLQTIPLNALGQETWQTMLDTAEVFHEARKQCLEALEGFPWETQSAASVAEHIRCSGCESSLVVPEFSPDTNAGVPLFRCRACGSTTDLQGVLETALEDLHGFENYRSVKHGGNTETADCPECSAAAFVFSEGECAVCGYSPSYSACARCGAGISLDEQEFGGFCSYCHYVLNKDD